MARTKRPKVFRGDRLKQMREKRGLSQEDLARNLNTGQAQINRYENEDSQPEAPTLAKLATELQVTADWLLGLVDDPGEHYEIPDLTADELKIIAAYRRGDRAAAARLVLQEGE